MGVGLFCRRVDKNCLLCKGRLKEINSLKRCITDLERNLQSINAELAKGTLRGTELEDQVKIERQLGKKIERDLEEMQSNSSSSGSRSDSGSDSQYDWCSSDKNIDVSSKISKKWEWRRSEGKCQTAPRPRQKETRRQRESFHTYQRKTSSKKK